MRFLKSNNTQAVIIMKHSHSRTFIRISLLSMLLVLTFILPGKSQFVDLGQDPCNVRWRQIKTDCFQIIYPDFFEENAQYLANIYAKLYAHANTLGMSAKKMSMIVRANGGISNGNAGWAPKKSELYTAPPQEVNDAWLEHLCIHEFRHIVQYDKVNQSFTKALYYIFGEQITMAVIGIYIPMWFLEGDATVFETSVGKGGRGRSPEFLNEMKAQVMEKGIYPYYKAVMGSYKDFVPNRYIMGYYMVGNSRNHYGTRLWADALTRVGCRPYGISPFARSLKLTMNGKRDSLWSSPHFQSLFVHPDSVKKANTFNDSKRTLYHDNFSELQQIWKREADPIEHTFDTISTRDQVYANYHYPTSTGDGQVIAYKEGLAQAGAFVLLDNGKEKLITRTGNLYDYKFAYRDSVLLWSEYKYNLRWEHAGKMVLAQYDLRDQKYRRFPTHQNRYAPFVVGNHWGFVEIDKEDNASIVVTDTSFQTEIFRVRGKGDELFVHPSFDGKNKIITVVVTPRGKHLESIHIQTGERAAITADTDYEIDNPVTVDNRIIYRGAFNTNNALYCLDTPGDFGKRVLETKFGARYPLVSCDNDSLYFSFYTSNGYKPGKVALMQLQGSPIHHKTFPIADSVTQQEKWSFNLTADSTFTSRKYNKTLHLLNFHSWGPIFPDADNVDIDFGLAISSQNKLSTLFLTAGYVRGTGYQHGNWQVKASYKGFWPILQIEFKSGRNEDFSQNYIITNTKMDTKDTLLVTYRSQLTKGTATAQFPFNLSRKNYNRNVVPFLKYEIQTIHAIENKAYYVLNEQKWTRMSRNNPYRDIIGKPDNVTLQIMSYGLVINNQTRMNERDINPRWGQRMEVGYEHTPFKNLDYGHSLWADGRFYFPGFLPQHSLAFYWGHQNKSNKTRNYYGNQILSPRGISLHGYQLSTVHTSYKMPISYPDARIDPLLYIKRITTTAFFDAGWEKNKYSNKTVYSYGIEATADTHFFRLPFPVNLGFRTGYETKTKAMFVDVIFSVGLTI